MKGKPSGEAFDCTDFKTKTELAVDLLTWARQRGFGPTAVLFDAFYLSGTVVQILRKADRPWLGRIKGNRNLKRNRKKFKPQDWPRLAWPSKVRRKTRAPRLSRSAAAAPHGWGPVSVIAVRHHRDAELRCPVGSNTAWARGRIEARYGHRLKSETGFRRTSSLLGLHDCQCRSSRAQENHVALVSSAYQFPTRQCHRDESTGEVPKRLNAHAVVNAPAGHSEGSSGREGAKSETWGWGRREDFRQRCVTLEQDIRYCAKHIS